MSRGLDRDEESRDYSSERARQDRRVAEELRRQERAREPREQAAEPKDGRAKDDEFEIHHLPARNPEKQGVADRTTSFERRRDICHRDRQYQLRESEIETLTEVGRFRTLDVEDLGTFRYEGDGRRMRGDLRSLQDQGLVETHRIRTSEGGRLDVAVLSKEGRGLARRFGKPADQRYFSGMVKPREAAHDTAIYRMFQAEAEQIRAGGGEVTRVVLDHELKSRVFGALEKQRHEALEGEDFERIQAKVAQANGLHVVDQKVPLPDLQIEYRTADGGLSRVNLELTTDNYKGVQIAAKASAGFKLYSLGDSSGGSPVRDEREITADILSL